MKAFLEKHKHTLINIGAVLTIGPAMAWYSWDKYRQGDLFNFVQIGFLVHNVIWMVIFLVRRPHVAVDRNLFHQGVALLAFYSGLGFRGQDTTDPLLWAAAQAVAGAAIVLGILTLLNLGRSFGIFIAVRKVKTDWLYSVIRHPMYLSDIVWKIGMVLLMPYLLNAAVLVLSVGCYVYRAILEERFLCQFPEYRQYMKKVRYRFIPGVF